ncbi:fasciclin domain-containing protein [Psychrobacter sp.]|uniref:fasciclin domain-containing protein n=1 Tax=Psychrobacter sp. TaxID=56811 RepID=UPI0025EE8C1E|nr:fasciclin domain-containing protein [Psychrobacter sp.]
MKTTPVWTLAFLMAAFGCQYAAQSATPSSTKISQQFLVTDSKSFNRLDLSSNATYSSFSQPTPYINPAPIKSSAPSASEISYDASENALEMARRNPNLSILVEAIEAAGLSGALRFAGKNYTIFAPDNAAFEAWFNETTMTKQKLMHNKPLLRILLGYHVAKTSQPLNLAQLHSSRLTTFNNHQLTITDQKTIQDGIGRTASIKVANIPTRNGTVHVIDKVLFPEG